jgi:small subunit ribosomal protein S16
MEVRIRMQKAGKSASKRYNYRIVAISRAKSRQADHLDLIGHYDPSKKPAVISINKVKLEKWIKQGARMSDTVRSLVKKLK